MSNTSVNDKEGELSSWRQKKVVLVKMLHKSEFRKFINGLCNDPTFCQSDELHLHVYESIGQKV
jgi:hypothetical protein